MQTGAHAAADNINNAWGVWDITTPVATPYDNWTNPASARATEASVVHGLLFGAPTAFHGAGVESNSIPRRLPDPHMMCLKLGKRHYCDDTVVPESSTVGKRGKPLYPSSPVPRCQVEGCHVVLSSAKEYYRKHKVCEIHSKAPDVMVLGLRQRFCQQCSRFHRVTEFDEAKRSCRRRLKGHNQRRRKGSLPTERSLPPSQSNPGCALSLLSSPKTEIWNSSSDLSSRCSAALYELIAENRANYVSGHVLNQNTYQQSVPGNASKALPDTLKWDRFGPTTARDLKQAPALEFGLSSMKEKSEDPEEWTETCWSSFGGAGVM